MIDKLWCVLVCHVVEVGVQVDSPMAKGPQLQVYKENFEDLFLKETVRYYAKESTAFLERNPVAEYIKKVEVRLAEEEHRVQMYLHETSQDPVRLDIGASSTCLHFSSLWFSCNSLLGSWRKS